MVGFRVEPQDVARGTWEKAEKDTFPGGRDKFSATTTRGSNPDATTERAEASEVISLIEGKLERGGGLVAGGQGVVDAQPMVKSVGPKTGVEIGTGEESANGIGDDEVTAFDRTILMGGVGAGGAEFIAELGEEGAHLRIGIKLATLIKMNVFIRTGGTAFAKEGTEPINRGSLRDTSSSHLEPGEVVRDKDPASLAVKANKRGVAGGVRRVGAGEREVDREALEGDGGATCRVGAGRSFSLLSTDAGGACVQDGIHVLELRDTGDKLVGII